MFLELELSYQFLVTDPPVSLLTHDSDTSQSSSLGVTTNTIRLLSVNTSCDYSERDGVIICNLLSVYTFDSVSTATFEDRSYSGSYVLIYAISY